jgi:adenine-specific DNA-methyltransferase
MDEDALRDFLLSRVPEDGSAIGNGALFALLRGELSDLSEEDYHATRDALIDEGVLERGRGRGGSVRRAIASEDEDDEEGEDFALTAPEAATPARRKATGNAKRKPAGPVAVASYRHGETRANNPEVGVVHSANDPDGPKKRWAYDPHIDPALMFDSARGVVERLIDDALAAGDAATMRTALEELKRMQAPYLAWAGKAERTSFEVDTVSLHVHERIDPATILANAKKRMAEGGADAWGQADLFGEAFAPLPLRQVLDFYRHEKGWANRLVAGDSLLVMNSLLQKEGMAGKVQMIYIDPPYGIKYGSNFQPFTSKRDVKDGADVDLTQEPEMLKAFRDTWELGIHSYLTHLRDRLLLARELLHESGSVFVQISDENLHRVRSLLDEVFGLPNFVGQIIIQKTGGFTRKTLPLIEDYLVWYAKDLNALKYRDIREHSSFPEAGDKYYRKLQLHNGSFRILSKSESDEPEITIDQGRIFRHGPLNSDGPSSNPKPFLFQGIEYECNSNRHWTVDAETDLPRVARSGHVFPMGNDVAFKLFWDFNPSKQRGNVWLDTQSGGFNSEKVYVVQTTEKVIERCLLMTTDPGDLVLDPTCGSGTTAFVAEKWGRRWITCDSSRVAITLAKQRLMTASFDWFTLRYPHEGLKGGFVYQTVPHVTPKSIANNPEIDVIYSEKHPAIAAVLDDLNAALLASPPAPFKPAQGYRKGKAVAFSTGERLEDWEVPFDWPADWPEAAKAHFDAFHAARQAMQKAMDASIAANAEQETLYDKPEKDPARLRVTGPFTVEAVPAPTVLSMDEAAPPQEADSSIARQGETSRQAQWRDELLRTGIRAKGKDADGKQKFIRLADLEAVPGCRHLHASGTVAEGADAGARLLVSFGPEHAALEQRQVELALDEAAKLRPAARFIVFAAFAFDPEAAKDIDEVTWPGVTLLKAQMNTDLLTEDLKKARASNQSFWLMGQPEVDLKRVGDDWQVEVHGFDYFDPVKGDLVSGGKANIAMWLLDTDYDGRSLMPSQLFFPMAGAQDGWNRLKKTIRAELDEELLEQFHGTVSLPFKAGENARVAVKIVDDRGIESLRILPLG